MAEIQIEMDVLDLIQANLERALSLIRRWGDASGEVTHDAVVVEDAVDQALTLLEDASSEGWIKVSDKKPPVGIQVLVWIVYAGYHGGSFALAEYAGPKGGFGRSLVLGRGHRVEYWMRLGYPPVHKGVIAEHPTESENGEDGG